MNVYLSNHYIYSIVILNAINNKPYFWQKDSIVKNLIVKRHANPDQCNDTGWSSLHHAAYNGHYQTSKILIENGAKIDVYNHLGATALHIAVARGHLSIIRYLNTLSLCIVTSDSFILLRIHFSSNTNGKSNPNSMFLSISKITW